MRSGVAIPDVIDILRGKYLYEELHRRTLARWYKKYPLGKNQPSILKGLEDPIRDLARQEAERRDAERDHSARMDTHWTALLDSLDDLRGIEAFPLHHPDLVLWVSQPTVPCWPMVKGSMCRNARGQVTVLMDVEKLYAFQQLKQHIPDDPFWPFFQTWKRSMAKDIGSRMHLLRGVIRYIEKPVSRGGLGIPVIPNLGFGGTAEPAVDLFYAFSIYDRALSMSLGLTSVPHNDDAFSQSSPEVIELEGRPAISAKDPAQIAEIKDFLYRAETEWARRPETRAVTVTYRQAEEDTRLLNAHREKLQAISPIPTGTDCTACRIWAANGDRDTPSGS